MKKFFVALAVLFFSHVAMAQTNATPFGVEIGVAKMADVQREIGAKTKLVPVGQNQYSGGKMFKADGAGLGVDGVDSLLLIFDQSDTVAAVIVTMPKDPKSLAKTFSTKYQTVSNRVDGFMNYGYAKFQKGNSFIEIDAPHLSFEMEVRYLTKALMASYQQQRAAEDSAKSRKKADSL